MGRFLLFMAQKNPGPKRTRKFESQRDRAYAFERDLQHPPYFLNGSGMVDDLSDEDLERVVTTPRMTFRRLFKF